MIYRTIVFEEEMYGNNNRGWGYRSFKDRMLEEEIFDGNESAFKEWLYYYTHFDGYTGDEGFPIFDLEDILNWELKTTDELLNDFTVEESFSSKTNLVQNLGDAILDCGFDLLDYCTDPKVYTVVNEVLMSSDPSLLSAYAVSGMIIVIKNIVKCIFACICDAHQNNEEEQMERRNDIVSYISNLMEYELLVIPNDDLYLIRKNAISNDDYFEDGLGPYYEPEFHGYRQGDHCVNVIIDFEDFTNEIGNEYESSAATTIYYDNTDRRADQAIHIEEIIWHYKEITPREFIKFIYSIINKNGFGEASRFNYVDPADISEYLSTGTVHNIPIEREEFMEYILGIYEIGANDCHQDPYIDLGLVGDDDNEVLAKQIIDESGELYYLVLQTGYDIDWMEVNSAFY